MKAIVAASVVAAYVAAVFFGAPAAGPRAAAWLLPVLSALFVWAYLRLARGGPVPPLVLVVVLTLAFPLAVLTWIGLPSHQDWLASLRAVLQSLGEHGSLFGLEMGMSSFAAVLVAIAVRGFGRSSDQGEVPHAP